MPAKKKQPAANAATTPAAKAAAKATPAKTARTPAPAATVHLLDRAAIEAAEDVALAPYALRARDSRGRRHREPEHQYRTCFQRDRDRIIHSDAFRRLEYKTQVFLNWEGDHFRTRLTHSIEVSQCARTIARVLRLNEEVCEAVALAHDLGHTPFGHAGEVAMRQCMEGHGGYEHNGQSLRIVDELERRYIGFPGLNLTHEVRYGLMKHETDYDKPLFSGLERRESASLEAQIVNFADEISYNAHDAEDGLYAGMITVDEACESELFAEAVKAAEALGIRGDPARLRYFIVGYLKNAQVSDLIQETARRLAHHRIAATEDVLAWTGPRLVAFTPPMAEKVKRLKHMLYNRFYSHRRVLRSMEKATRFMKEMFGRYVEEPILMPGGFFGRVEKGKEDPHRVVCDYISGMTDRYALDQYKKLFDPDIW
jgi:dGTPase